MARRPITRRGRRSQSRGRAASDALAVDRPEVADAFDRLYGGNDPAGRAWHQGRAARTELIAGLPPAPDAAGNAAPPPNGFPLQAQRLAGLLQHNRNIRL